MYLYSLFEVIRKKKGKGGCFQRSANEVFVEKKSCTGVEISGRRSKVEVKVAISYNGENYQVCITGHKGS